MLCMCCIIDHKLTTSPRHAAVRHARPGRKSRPSRPAVWLDLWSSSKSLGRVRAMLAKGSGVFFRRLLQAEPVLKSVSPHTGLPLMLKNLSLELAGTSAVRLSGCCTDFL